MARRRNPTSNHPTAGAFIGSLVGTVPGGLVKSTPLMIVGSIIGGGVGGAVGAQADRKKRSGVGGAVGGVFGPIGAAIGGYVGGKKPDQYVGRRQNPAGLTTALAIGGGILAVGLGYGAYRVVQRRRKQALPSPSATPLPATTPEESLQKIVGNSTLEEATFLVGDVQQPIFLRTSQNPLPIDDEFDRVGEFKVKVERPEGETTIEQSAGVAFGTSDGADRLVLVDENGDYAVYVTPKKAIAYLITGLKPEYARLAYELALVQIGEKGVDWSDLAQRDLATEEILTTMAPRLDWSRGLEPYTYGSMPYKVWNGVQTMGTVANQSYFNKKVMA